MLKCFIFKMYFGHYSLVSMRYTILITILSNYIYKSNGLETVSDIRNVPYFTNITALDDLVSLPKEYLLKLISKNTEQYLSGQQNDDVYLNGTQLIEKYGYKVEEHHVTTSDGYNLALYRIPGHGRVVFLMHGIMCSFVDWLTVGPEQALPFLLANEGYDVWMGNARGNTFSRKNERIPPSDPVFWEFSFNEIGTRDLPAIIDYVLAKTNNKKLTYIGHSQGTTSFFVLCSMKPEYNDKVDLMVALSAVAWMKHIPNPILQIGSLIHKILYALGKALGFNEIAPDNNLKKALTQTFCGDVFFATIICQNILFLIAGFDYAQVNYYQLPVIFSHFPSGSSILQLEHYAQLIVSGYFRQFDHGANLNFEKYGSLTPPSYPLEKISVPIAIFYSQGDWLASTTDVDILRRKLKNVLHFNEVRLTSFNHVDYLWASDVKRLLYDKILSIIDDL